ncbi:MAG: winged helix-turn-helix domain-containing protein [Pseudodesulfovibrio sp.]
MSPTIRIDDEVYQGLKKIADPFEDTPNTVIKRLLTNANVLQQKKAPIKQKKVRSGVLTPQPVYEAWLIYTMWNSFQGKGSKRDIVASVREAMEEKQILNPEDYELVSTGEPRCENTIAWGRKSLIDQGLLKNDSERGVWELSEKGILYAQRLTTTSLLEME